MQLALLYMMIFSPVCVLLNLCVHWMFLHVIHRLESHFWHWPLQADRGEMSALTKMSFKLLGFLKAKTGGSLKILHSSGCFYMVVQCSRTMLDKLLSAGWYVMTSDTLLFAFFSLYWMRSFLSMPLALLKQWLMLALL